MAVHLQLLRGGVLGGYCVTNIEVTVLGEDPSFLAATRTECIALLSHAVAALERRRVAGTLLDGKCSAVEENWRSDMMRHARYTAADAACWAPMVGYHAHMCGASSTLIVLSNAALFAAVCSEAQFQAFTEHVAHAAELMQQPRRNNDDAMEFEVKFSRVLPYVVATAAGKGLDACLVQRLMGAWQRLQESGVVQTRSIAAEFAARAPEFRDACAAVVKSLNAPGLRTCALDGCGAREAHPAHFKSCAACRTVAYCSKEHQVADWPSHKKACRAARKAAAEVKDGAGPSGA